MFDGFERKQITTSGTTINLMHGGSGPPLLLLHGYPQTHVMWHKVALRLAQDFTVVASDLRGYGDSGKPPGDSEHVTYSKRVMAQDQVEVMQQLGHDEFFVAAHDRGARVAHRMALDHPQRVRKLALLDIRPTRDMFSNVNKEMATGTWHWFFLIQPYDFPERIIGASADYFLRSRFQRVPDAARLFPPEVLDEYARCFCDPAAIHATCEDYRAAATIDLEHDRKDLGRKIAMPVLVLWGKQGVIARMFRPLADWREVARDVRGRALDCGHFLPEEKPVEVLTELRRFLARHRDR